MYVVCMHASVGINFRDTLSTPRNHSHHPDLRGIDGERKRESKWVRGRWKSGKEGRKNTVKLSKHPMPAKANGVGAVDTPERLGICETSFCHSTHFVRPHQHPLRLRQTDLQWSRPKDGCAKIGGLGRGGRKGGDCPSGSHKPSRLGRPRRPREGGVEGGWGFEKTPGFVEVASCLARVGGVRKKRVNRTIPISQESRGPLKKKKAVPSSITPV